MKPPNSVQSGKLWPAGATTAIASNGLLGWITPTSAATNPSRSPGTVDAARATKRSSRVVVTCGASVSWLPASTATVSAAPSAAWAHSEPPR